MTAIASLTMNPALDVSTSTPRVRPTDKLRCGPPRHDAGGGGINVARVLHELGAPGTAVFPSGGPAGATIEMLLQEAGIDFRPVRIAGAVRESVTVDETDTGAQFRFVLPGPTFTTAECDAVLASLAALPVPPRWIVASGSLPPGVPNDFYCDVAALARRIGAQLILDTSGAALAGAEGADAFLIKPSLRELSDLAGRGLNDDAAIVAAARDLIARRFAGAIAVSLGERGAFLVTAHEVDTLPAPAVEPHSAVGAGDSMVAAIALALSRDVPLAQAVTFGVATGAAALMTDATGLVRRADVERLTAIPPTPAVRR